MGNAGFSEDSGVTYQGHYENNEESLRSGKEVYEDLDKKLGGILSPAHRLVDKDTSQIHFVVEYKHKDNNAKNEFIYVITNKVANSLWEGTVTLTKEGKAFNSKNEEVSVTSTQWKEFKKAIDDLIINTT